MIFDIESDFDQQTHKEVTTTVDIPEAVIRELVRWHIDRMTYAARQVFIESKCKAVDKKDND